MKKILNIDEVKLEKKVRITISPRELRSKLMIPKVQYYIAAEAKVDAVFSGMVMPIPKVLIYYLHSTELMILTLIMEECNDTGYCYFTNPEMSVRLGLSPVSIGIGLQSLRKMGLLAERPNGSQGAGRARRINYDTVQYLNDLMEGENPGVLVRVRKRFSRRSILKITKADIKNAYNNKLLDPDHDPAEEEEYD